MALKSAMARSGLSATQLKEKKNDKLGSSKFFKKVINSVNMSLTLQDSQKAIAITYLQIFSSIKLHNSSLKIVTIKQWFKHVTTTKIDLLSNNSSS